MISSIDVACRPHVTSLPAVAGADVEAPATSMLTEDVLSTSRTIETLLSAGVPGSRVKEVIAVIRPVVDDMYAVSASRQLVLSPHFMLKKDHFSPVMFFSVDLELTKARVHWTAVSDAAAANAARAQQLAVAAAVEEVWSRAHDLFSCSGVLTRCFLTPSLFKDSH